MSFYARPGFSLLVLGILAGTGAVLVALGIYGVLAYTVSQQTREIAIRMALGGEAGHVVRMIVRFGLGLIAAGLVIGLAISFATNRLLTAQLWRHIAQRSPDVRGRDSSNHHYRGARMLGARETRRWRSADDGPETRITKGAQDRSRHHRAPGDSRVRGQSEWDVGRRRPPSRSRASARWPLARAPSASAKNRDRSGASRREAQSRVSATASRQNWSGREDSNLRPLGPEPMHNSQNGSRNRQLCAKHRPAYAQRAIIAHGGPP